ncbi:MAG: insulinase family protein [Deltaproteobacteria bacterium]|nr:insulinase family protein [Deltaproteobacteria bacterium]
MRRFPVLSVCCMLVVFLISGVLFQGHASGQEVRPSDAYRVPSLTMLTPEERGAVDRVIPSLERDLWVTLKNGLTVILREVPGAPAVSNQVWIKTGSIFEGKDLSAGMTHYLEHIVSGGATERRTEEQNKELLRKLGGATNAYTSFDRTVYFIDTTPDKVKEALDLLLSYATECVLDLKEVEREKKVIEREILMNQNNPDRELWKLFSETAYLDNPVRYPIIGYLSRFLQVQQKDLEAYYKDRYVLSNMIVSVAGGVDPRQALKAVISLTKDTPISIPKPVYIPEEPPQTAPRRAEIRSAIARVARIEAGFRTVRLTDPDLYALDVLAMVMGDGRTSRLHQALKEQDQFVLSVSSSSWTPWFVNGVFSVSMELSPENVDAALDRMWAEIGKMQKEGPLPDELERAKRKVQAQYVYNQQSPSGMARELASSVYSSGDAYFNRFYTDRIQEVTAEQVQAAARSYLRPNRITVAVMRPEIQAKADNEPGEVSKALSPVQMHTLDNGLRVLLQNDETLPMVAIRLYGDGGTRYDPPEEPGLCHFMARMLTRGAGDLTANDIDRRVEDMGAELASGSGRNTYYLRGDALKADFERMMELMATVLTGPTFPEEEISKLRQDTLLAIHRMDENWVQEVDRIFRRSQFDKDHLKNDILGDTTSVSALTRPELVRFHKELIQPNHMVLAVFGDVKTDEVIPVIEKTFGKLKAAELPSVEEYPREFQIKQDEVISRKDEKTASGIMVVYQGIPLLDPRRPFMDVIDVMESGRRYPGGWLFDSLRGGDKSLVYVVSGYPVYHFQGGFYEILAQSAPKDSEEVIGVIRTQMAKLAAGGFSEEELEQAKDLCITAHKISLDTLSSRADSAALDELVGLGYNYSQEYPALIRSVTRESVIDLSKLLFGAAVVVKTEPAGQTGDVAYSTGR